MSKQPPRKPLGKALNRSDADLDRLSQISQDDLDAALASAEPAMRDLLDAEPIEEDERG